MFPARRVYSEYLFRDKCESVGAIVITLDSIGSLTSCVGATTIALDSIGAATTTLDYSRLCRVRGLITPAFVGAALNTPSSVGS